MTFGENFEQSKNGRYFTIETMADFLSTAGSVPLCGGQTKYINLPASFDIETTSVLLSDNTPAGIMYCFSFCMNGACFFGRTYDDLQALFATLIKHYHISMKRRLRVYVRNLGFEFQFIRKHFEWFNVYARQTRTPMSAITTSGIDFRCSLVLTNEKLKDTAKNLRAYPIEKLDTLDYRQMRHYLTPMTDREIQYSLNDVLIDASMIYDKLQTEHSITHIPLTATSYVRRLVRANCMPYNDVKRWKYARQIARMSLSVPEYTCALLAFAGGFVHASPLSAMSDVYNCASLDWTSAYPANMVCEAEYPISKGMEIDARTITTRDELIRIADNFAFIGSFEFYDIESKTNIDYYISVSKTRNGKGIESFNGRIASAEYIQICLTHIDFLTILKTYNIGSMRVLRLWQYRKGYLPRDYILTVLDLYNKKTTLKGVDGMEAEYMNSKRDVNSLYGMLVTQIDRPNAVYNADTGTWSLEQTDTAASLDKYNNDDKRFISYLWGILVTALCRRNIFDAILTVGDDYHYSDTDSVKITNYEKHKWYFDEYNRNIDIKMQRAAAMVGFDYELTRPKNIKGKIKPLGYWEYEGTYQRAKFLNAKRYIYVQDNKLHVTIAGTGKESTAKYLMAVYGTIDNVFAHFDDGLLIKGELTDDNGTVIGGTGKLTHIYNDNAVEFDMTDYTGRTAHVSELSSVYLTPCDYALGFPAEFLRFVRRFSDGIIVKPEIPFEI